MSKMIRTVAELPEWFDIHSYEEWEDKDPHESALAVSDRFFFWRCAEAMMYTGPGSKYVASDEEVEVALNCLAESSVRPFDRLVMRPMEEVFKVQRHRYQEKSIAEELDEIDRIDELYYEQIQTSAKNILGESYYSDVESKVKFVTLWHAVEFMEENESLIEELEQSSKLLAEKYGKSIEEARKDIFAHVPMHGDDGSSFVQLSGHPTIESEVQEIRRYLAQNHAGEGSVPKVRQSEVRKLFDYRAAAFADLRIWACLVQADITAKCMATALFPDGRFGELDMRPSRTVGSFFKKLKEDRGYIDDLTGKAAEMESLQN